MEFSPWAIALPMPINRTENLLSKKKNRTENHMAPRGTGTLVLKSKIPCCNVSKIMYVVHLKLSLAATIQFEIHL
jgi:hypothetical protein